MVKSAQILIFLIFLLMCFKRCRKYICSILFAGQEYVSSLPLQMILYFNVFFFPFWFIIEVVMLAEKVTTKSCYLNAVLLNVDVQIISKILLCVECN